jgi:hypothetical protein
MEYELLVEAIDEMIRLAVPELVTEAARVAVLPSLHTAKRQAGGADSQLRRWDGDSCSTKNNRDGHRRRSAGNHDLPADRAQDCGLESYCKVGCLSRGNFPARDDTGRGKAGAANCNGGNVSLNVAGVG